MWFHLTEISIPSSLVSQEIAIEIYLEFLFVLCRSIQSSLRGKRWHIWTKKWKDGLRLQLFPLTSVNHFFIEHLFISCSMRASFIKFYRSQCKLQWILPLVTLHHYAALNSLLYYACLSVYAKLSIGTCRTILKNALLCWRKELIC